MKNGRLSAAIRRTGTEATLLKAGEKLCFIASIQPMLQHADEENSRIGLGAPRRYTLFAPCGPQADLLEAGDTVESAGCRFRVLDTRQILLGKNPAYRWASLLEEMGGGGCAG